MEASARGRLYYALERARHGVRPAMVREAVQLLDRPWAQVESYVRDRLRQTHGPSASPEWLLRRPLVERSTLSGAMAEARRFSRRRNVELRRTSGSTGTPFSFVKDREMTAWMNAAMWAVYSWHGVAPGQRQARFWGFPTTQAARFRRRVLDRLLVRRRLSAFEVNPGRSAQFFHQLMRFRPTHAYGYPTLMHEFVDHCLSAGLDGAELRLRVVVSTGEILNPHVRAKISRFFGCPVVNEYGCSESGIVGMECESGTLHQVPVATMAEVVDSSGRRVPVGEDGEVVVTDLYGAVMPLLRYRLHDRARPSAGIQCSCGRDLPSLDIREGRIDRFIQTANGPIYDAILAYSVPAEVTRFRAYQRALGHLEAYIVTGTGTDPEEARARCRQKWEEVLAGSVRVTVHVVDQLPYEVSGKLRYFIPMETPAPDGAVGVTSAWTREASA